MPDVTVNFGFPIPKTDGSDLNEPARWRDPITMIDTQLKTTDSAAQGDWQAYTPTFTGSTGGSPSIGTGTLVGRYKKSGKTVDWYIKLNIGATNFGTGITIFSLPFAVDPAKFVQGSPVGYGIIQNASSLSKPVIVCLFNTTSTTYMVRCTNEAVVDNGGPGAPWAPGNVIELRGRYEAAA